MNDDGYDEYARDQLDKAHAKINEINEYYNINFSAQANGISLDDFLELTRRSLSNPNLAKDVAAVLRLFSNYLILKASVAQLEAPYVPLLGGQNEQN
jgi:hypothetical protein